jgi:hypothetical protein
MRTTGSKFLLINIGLLRRFRTATAVVDLFNDGSWKSYSGVWPQISKLLKLGLIVWVYSNINAGDWGSHRKKFYVLSRKGRILLALFPEKGVVDEGLLEAGL